MKTTIDIPDPLFRRAKSKAAERGQTLKEFVADALQARLETRAGSSRSAEPDWMQGFGDLGSLHKETLRIQRRINETFGVVEAEDRA